MKKEYKILNKLSPGLYKFIINKKTNVFYKNDDNYCPFNIIGSDEVYSSQKIYEMFFVKDQDSLNTIKLIS